MRAPHPFPARMAPELALASVSRVKIGPILDPMCGSGMVLKAALGAGKTAIGFDVDPLAVLMSRVWTSAPPDNLEGAADAVVSKALLLRTPHLPWMDDDKETCTFVDFWFGKAQQRDLRRLAATIHVSTDTAERDALRLALSRIIIVKSRGASLASDVSHSRPHRTRAENDYDVYSGFKLAARNISRALAVSATRADASVGLGDARQLSTVKEGSVGMVVTSPPYLNAIDYLRGHRLALVWLGHRISDLRTIRSGSIGAERSMRSDLVATEVPGLLDSLRLTEFDPRLNGMLTRYVFDLNRMMAECYRVLRPGAEAVMVVGNCTIRGQFVDNATFVAAAGERQGLRLILRTERELPASRRYLPPPRADDEALLSRRMRTEAVLRLQKPAVA